ncbi:MAG: transcription-repair coupling factor, partial [Bdellovibrionia bacterium]
FLPVYKISQIQRFSSAANVQTLDRLGGTSWKKATIKVRSHLREVAGELLKLYAERSQVERDPYPSPDDEYRAFEAFFPYAETEDQLKAIDAILSDLSKSKPMDRLICGDVGFGKTEVAMRAAFKVAQSGKQVAVLVPTTTLAIQHLETFRKRFKKWPVRIGGFSRFTSTSESSKVISELKEGKLDIVIGTHRLFSRDIEYKDLGLLIVDEEQKFGVTHKEKIRKMRIHVDTLALSATPIPRTLNMSLMGIRDLSLINTPPQDRLPTRTFVVRNNPEVIRKAIQSEIARGGQVLYVHNRIQSIYGLQDELKSIVPGVNIRVGHGQMDEKELENTIIGFFNNEFQVLLCTTIIESGMDIPRANTMIVDRSDTFGLSQLYQLRGRVGRGQERAYCYLMIPSNVKLDPDAQERLKVLQENTALGSGLKIAHYDMELRGTGDILGEDQSGHISAVGYDLYLELLEDALREIRGDRKTSETVDPEINLRIPAFIPDEYIPDIRVRLTFYKMLSDAKTPQAIDRIEEDLRDRFGEAPEAALNLLGISLIRQLCQDLLIKDVSLGPKNLLLTFSEKTALSPEKIIQLAMRPEKKYRLSPNNRVSVRMEKQSWVQVHEELTYLKNMV